MITKLHIVFDILNTARGGQRGPGGGEPGGTA